MRVVVTNEKITLGMLIDLERSGKNGAGDVFAPLAEWLWYFVENDNGTVPERDEAERMCLQLNYTQIAEINEAIRVLMEAEKKRQSPETSASESSAQ